MPLNLGVLEPSHAVTICRAQSGDEVTFQIDPSKCSPSRLSEITAELVKHEFVILEETVGSTEKGTKHKVTIKRS